MLTQEETNAMAHAIELFMSGKTKVMIKPAIIRRGRVVRFAVYQWR